MFLLSLLREYIRLIIFHLHKEREEERVKGGGDGEREIAFAERDLRDVKQK